MHSGCVNVTGADISFEVEFVNLFIAIYHSFESCLRNIGELRSEFRQTTLTHP